MRRYPLLPLLLPLLLASSVGCGDGEGGADDAAVAAIDASIGGDAAIAGDATIHDDDAAVSGTTIVLGAPITIEGDTTNITIDAEGVLVARGGTIRVVGTATNATIRVDAGEAASTLVLDGVDLRSTGAPAILFLSSSDARVQIPAGTSSTLAGGGDTYDGALYGVPSLTFEGEGELHVDGTVQEGVASDMNLVLDGPSIYVTSVDDGLNASTDRVSLISIRSGYLNVDAGGDGVDSNGAIEILGGTIVTSSRLSSDPNTGLDADLGVTIDGGTVVSTGASSGGGRPGGGPSGSASGDQAQLQASVSVDAGELLVVLDGTTPLLAFRATNAYRGVVLSAASFVAGTSYTLSRGGTIEGTERDGLYETITSYSGGSAAGTATAR